MSFGEVVCYAKHFFEYEIFGGILQKIIVGRLHSIPFDSILFDLIRFGLVEPRCVHSRQQKIRQAEKAKEHETNSRSTSIKHNSNSNGMFISAVFQAFSLYD